MKKLLLFCEKNCKKCYKGKNNVLKVIDKCKKSDKIKFKLLGGVIMKKEFYIIIKYNKNFDNKNLYNTNADYSCGCSVINNTNINEMPKIK